MVKFEFGNERWRFGVKCIAEALDMGYHGGFLWKYGLLESTRLHSTSSKAIKFAGHVNLERRKNACPGC